ncbi:MULTISPECIES: TetR/AcrR family transcriptional regulator [unclassified Synechococcus]|uniref:TetR/AcrR family transcriptional regulator n=1 Tax=unclassified Synechococcus TaxID=2626047 RepID=UPI001682D6A3|nr:MULTISPECIES: TetR/AcrR family transcriptional regulator [unclassified Synechococcus]MBD2719988.1 TetR/AcrR family transcriptional regulator [Synechococcus sp. FACHB-909]
MAAPPRDRLLSAARELFFQHGFARVSTDALARAASVSKATLYKHFPSMEALLRAVVETEVDGFEQGVPVAVATEAAFHAALVQYGANLLDFLNQADIIRFAQLMFEEARGSTGLAADFYDSAYGRTQNDLAQLIQQGLDRGYLSSALGAAVLAEQLLGLWEGFGFVRALLGLTARPFPNPRAWSQACVHTFLAGQGSGPLRSDEPIHS